MTQRANDIGLFKTGLRSRAEIIVSLHEDSGVVEALEGLFGSCRDSIARGGKIIFCGNGGFAAIAQHTVAELVGKLHAKRRPIPAVALGTDMSVLTCVANDFGFEQVFSRELEAIGAPGDIMIALSTSGKSKNILQALAQARRQHIESFAFVGRCCGDLARELGAGVIELPTNQTEIIQDLTMMLLHLLCEGIESHRIAEEQKTENVWDSIIDVACREHLTTLLLDRDGVINHLVPNGYVTTADDLVLNADFLSVAKTLSSTFSHIVVVTNQACIGKGKATDEAIDAVNALIVKAIKNAGGRIDAVYVCADANADSPMRKPNTGLAEKILSDFPSINFQKAIMAGDSYSDELFARRLGSMYFNISNV